MTLQGKRVLLVNDDGIDGPGIVLLEKIVRRWTEDVWVVAPDEERSGASQTISISHPIRYRQRDERHFAVRGSPTDCALLGINEFCGEKKPDILLSGINSGPNLAEDVLYSGTCGAAKEGALLGIPSIALSQLRSYDKPPTWESSERHLPGLIEGLVAAPAPFPGFLNVNVPNVPPDQIAGIEVTRQGQRPPGGFLPVRRVDERTVPYYWVKICPQESELVEGTDLHAIANNRISVTPMQIDLTMDAAMDDIRATLSTSAGRSEIVG